VIPNFGGLAELFRSYQLYRSLTGQEAWDLTPRELGLRLAALEDVRDRQREDLWRAVTAAVARALGDEDADKLLI
jgi:hypothetical protein